MEEMRANKQIILRLFGTVLFILAFSRHFFFELQTIENGMSVTLVVVAIAVSLLLERAALAERRTRLFGLLYGALISAALGIGQVLYINNSIRPLLTSMKTLASTALVVLGFTVGFGAAVTVLLDLVCRRSEAVPGQKSGKLWKILSGKYGFLLLVLVLFLAWLPCYLAYYPGVMSYDMYEDGAPGQLWQIANGEYSTFHPPLHTGLMHLCLRAGALIGLHGIVLYSLLQMLLMAMLLAAVLRWLIRCGCRPGTVLFAGLYFALHPVVAIFSFVPAKDVLFAGLFCLLTLMLYRCLAETEEPSLLHRPAHAAALAAVALLCCLLRKNAVYALLLAAPFLVLALKQYRRRLLGAVCAVAAGLFLIQSLLFPALGVEKTGSAEMFSVPIQQLANTYHAAADTLTAEEKETIERYLPKDVLPEYNPRFADPVKNHFSQEAYRADAKGFWSLWLDLFLKYPTQYVDAFLTLNLPYWYPDAFSLDKYAYRKYLETYINESEQYGFERQSLLPPLLAVYEGVASYSLPAKIPLFGTLCSITLPIWVLLFCCTVFLLKRQYRLCCVLLPGIFLWLTLMAGPVSNLRYIFPILLQYPLLLAFILQPSTAHGLAEEAASDRDHTLSETAES